MATTKEFKHAISVLKKQGLVPAKIDARKVLPSFKVRGKRLDTLVRKHDDVISGKLQAVKVPPKELPNFKKLGFETEAKRVLVPITKSEVAKFKGGKIKIRSKTGMERVMLPVEYKNLRQYLSDIEGNASLINKMKERQEYFGIRFHGGQRANFFSNIQQLMEYFQTYDAIKEATGREAQEEVYQNLEIIRITRRGAEQLEHELETRKRKMTKAYNRRHAKRQREKTRRIPARLAIYRMKDAERKRELRKDLKKNKRAYKSYLLKARNRMRKLRVKRKGKKKK